MFIEFTRRDVQATVGNNPALIERIFTRMAQRDEFVVLLEIGKVERGRPAYGLQRLVARPFQRFSEPEQFTLRRQFVKAADANIDQMNLAPAEQRHDFIARLLQPQPAFDDGAMIFRHLESVLIAEKVRRVEQEDVQRVAFDPFAAVDKAPQRSQLPVHLDAESALHRVNGAHLVSDGADAADARRDVWRLAVMSPAQKGFKEARRLEDLQANVLDLAAFDLDVLGALAFDAGEVINFDRPGFHALHSPGGRPGPMR